MLKKAGLQKKLIFLSVAVLLLYYVLVYLFSALLMEPYYRNRVEKSLVDAFNSLQTLDTVDIATIAPLEEANITIVIADRDSGEILYNSQFTDHFRDDMMQRILPDIKVQTVESEDGYFITVDEMRRHTSAGVDISSGKRIMLGGITDHYFVEISTSYESITQAIHISETFSLAVGLFVMVVSILVFSRMSASVTKPVTQMTSAADKMAHLDFSERCQTDSGGEIGQLAKSINTMSDFMQSYFEQLQDANRQLKKDIQLQKEQDTARKNLVSNLSHDLKTPISLISGYADGLRSGMAKSDEEISDYCGIICDESDRMLSLIQKMTELFRIESGTIQLQPEVFDLSELVQYSLDVFNLEIMKDGIELDISLPEEAYVLSDYFSAETVITNYIQNAISHINGGKSMSIRIDELENSYIFRISNSSAPISAEELSRIWDNFYCLDKSRTGSRKNSGLGLSIVKGTMEQLGGDYGAANIEGGVEFRAAFHKAPDSKMTEAN